MNFASVYSDTFPPSDKSNIEHFHHLYSQLPSACTLHASNQLIYLLQDFCKRDKAKMWIHYKPSLFQHIGTHSSLKGKVQKLKVGDLNTELVARFEEGKNSNFTDRRLDIRTRNTRFVQTVGLDVTGVSLAELFQEINSDRFFNYTLMLRCYYHCKGTPIES